MLQPLFGYKTNNTIIELSYANTLIVVYSNDSLSVFRSRWKVTNMYTLTLGYNSHPHTGIGCT